MNIYRCVKGDDVDGHFFWRDLNYHYSFNPAARHDDCISGFDVRDLAVKLGYVESAPDNASEKLWSCSGAATRGLYQYMKMTDKTEYDIISEALAAGLISEDM